MMELSPYWGSLSIFKINLATATFLYKQKQFKKGKKKEYPFLFLPGKDFSNPIGKDLSTCLQIKRLIKFLVASTQAILVT